MDADTIVRNTRKLCQKFVDKVEFGRARSVETYSECIELLREIDEYYEENPLRQLID